MSDPQARIRELEEEVARLRRRSLQTVAGDRTVSVPDEFWPVFQIAQNTVNEYFAHFNADPTRATIEVAGQRYLLVRASALSFDFLNTIRRLYADRGEEEAFAIGKNLLFDLAHVIGINDARNFHQKMKLTEPLARLSAGPVHFAYTGWAYVDIEPTSVVSTDDDFCLHYHHPFSFEADSWVRAGNEAPEPVCIMNSGYSSGWCEESFGMPLTAVETSCIACGDDRCTFVMAPPDRIQEQVDRFLERQGHDVARKGGYDVPTFFERKRVEEEMALARRKAEESDHMKSQFLANMSHEIRTPLSAIHACVDLLEDDPEPALRRDYLKMMRSSIALLNTLISDILDVSKIEAGELHVEWAPTDVGEMLERVHRGFTALQRADDKPIEFRLLRGEEVPGVLMLDSARVEQVLGNLLENAWKFTESGAIELSCLLVDDRLELSVRDTGIGIGDAQLQTVFQPFRQVDEGLSRRRGGVGLGLAIVKHLVEAMDGDIQVTSSPGIETVFRVRLPCRPTSAVKGVGEVSGDGKAGDAGRRVLIVEDNDEIRLLIRALLERAGHKISECADGQAALDRLAGPESFDLVVMDVQMPGLDGLAAVRQLRARESTGEHLPMIALTAHAMKGDRETCLAAGFDSYLTKPIDRERLVAEIRLLTSAAASD